MSQLQAEVDVVIIGGGQAARHGHRKQLAMRLINSIYYEDVSFSWGDNKIFECAHGINNFIGNATQWVAIVKSPHIRYVLEEIGSFELAYQK